MSKLTRILLRLAVESAAEAAWRCVDAASAARDRLRGDSERELRAENRRLQMRVADLERVERYTRAARERRVAS